LIQRLREEQATLARSRSELAVTYLPSHPKIAAVDSELANIDRQIRAEAMKIVDSLEDQAKVASSRAASLKASLDAAKARASDTNQDEVKLRALEREASANRELLETFLNRFTDASARQDLRAQPGMARIIQRAAVPSAPSFPLPGPTILLATIAGLMLGLGLAFLAEVMAATTAGTAAAMPIAAPIVVSSAAPVVAPRHRPAVEIKKPAANSTESATEPVAPAWVAEPALMADGVVENEPEISRPPAAGPPLSGSQDAVELAPALCELPATSDTSAAIANAY